MRNFLIGVNQVDVIFERLIIVSYIYYLYLIKNGLNLASLLDDGSECFLRDNRISS